MLFVKHNRSTYTNLLKAWLRYKKETVKEQSYIKYYTLIEKHINPILGNMNYRSLTEKQIKAFFSDSRIANLALSTQRSLIYIIKSSINYGVSHNLCKPIGELNIKIKKPKAKIVYLTIKEQETLEKYLVLKKDIRKLGILMCLYTGIRLGEICGLCWKDIDFYNKSVSINRTVQRIKNNEKNALTKTKKIVSTPKSDSSKRTIPLPDFLIDLLLEFKSEPDNFILTNTPAFKDTRVYEKYFENALKKCNIRKLNFHTLRHTFATRCIESGMDIKTLSEILGHSSYRITLDVYVHSTIDQKRCCINNLVDYINPITEY